MFRYGGPRLIAGPDETKRRGQSAWLGRSPTGQHRSPSVSATIGREQRGRRGPPAAARSAQPRRRHQPDLTSSRARPKASRAAGRDRGFPSRPQIRCQRGSRLKDDRTFSGRRTTPAPSHRGCPWAERERLYSNRRRHTSRAPPEVRLQPEHAADRRKQRACYLVRPRVPSVGGGQEHGPGARCAPGDHIAHRVADHHRCP